MNPARDIVIIVDPFSTGALYAPLFRARGYHCFAVLSSSSVPARFVDGFSGHAFEGRELLSLAECLKVIPAARVRAVVAGSELGVETAERLALHFGVAGNDPATLAWRRDKFEMQQRLAAAGLRSIPTVKLSEAGDTRRALAQLGQGERFVIKPNNSFMTDGVEFIEGRQALEQALRWLEWGRINALGVRNSGYLVQAFVSGPEYVVDLVASAAGTLVVGLSRYRKAEHNGSRFVYEGLEVLDPRDERFADLIAYARACSKALEIGFGPVHMELLDSADGPVMIEVGARLHGGVAPSLFQECYAPDLLSVAVEAYLGFEPASAASRLIRPGRIVFLINRRLGARLARDEQRFAALQAIPSFRGFKPFAEPDEALPLTRDLASCPGIVWLAAAGEEELDRDERQVRQLFEECLGE